MLTAGVSFLNPGTASQILFSIILALGSMRVYSGYKPFIDEKLDRLAEVMQWQMILTMLGALALKANVDGESLEDKQWFDIMLVGLQFAGPLTMAISQWLDGGVKGVLEENVEGTGALFNIKTSFEESVTEMKKLKKVWRRSGDGKDGETQEKHDEIEMSDVNGKKGNDELGKRAKAKDFISQFRIGDHHPAPKEPKRLTEEEIERLGPPPVPTHLTDCIDVDINDGNL